MDLALLLQLSKCQVRLSVIAGIRLVMIGLGLVMLGALSGPTPAQEWSVAADRIEMKGNFAQAQLQVVEAGDAASANERTSDLTSVATYESSQPSIATVDRFGRVQAVSNGQAVIRVGHLGQQKEVAIDVQGMVDQPDLEFTEHIQPILYKAGCNAGACHASQYGKGGFTLSVMGFDPAADHYAMAHYGRGRRLSPSSPELSLLLKKATAQVPHGGGRRIEAGEIAYQILARWIAMGASAPKPEPRRVVRLEVTPKSRVGQVGFRQQLRVQAIYEDGGMRDVTSWARFDSMDEAVVRTDGRGVVEAIGPGQAPVMIRFADQAELSMVIVPYSDRADLDQWVSNNFVDELASKKFQELGITPSGLCDDATFLRRAFLDVTGSLPSPDEVDRFLASTDPNKRTQWIDRLLGLTGEPSQDIYNDRYAAYWSLKWADLIRNNSAVVGESGMWALHNWLKDSFRTNKSFDRFVQELITAKGSVYSNGPANYYRISNNPSDLAEATSQLFLGTRLQCAKCHHHPYEKFSQADYYSFAAFFSRVGSKSSTEFGVFGGETVVMVTSGGEVHHPKTGVVMKPTPLHGKPTDEVPDRRISLANWLTAAENDGFANNVANRYVAYLLGRGLVEPIDDLRSTNPPTNVELMDALSKEFRSHHFDVKRLMRSIMVSRLYQLESQPNENNRSDSKFYSHYRVKRLAAEPLLDCIDFATGVATKHPNLPLGTKATELPDAKTTSPFLMTFGKPKRASVCECERTPDENLSQALHMLNGEIVASKIADGGGRISKLLQAQKTPDEILNELYRVTISRPPGPQELEYARKLIAESPAPAEIYQDLLWALMNSKEFIFNH